MTKTRNKENKGLPARWRLKHGAYFYRVPDGMEYMWNGKKEFRLGSTLHEAYKEWANRASALIKSNNIGQLLDRYALDVIPTKAKITQRDNQRYIKSLKAVFGEMPLDAIEPKHIYEYVSIRSKKIDMPDDGKTREKKKQTGGMTIARREVALFSHAFTKAIEWGYISRHPLKGQVVLKAEKPRTRYVEDWEIIECLSLKPIKDRGGIASVQAYIRLKLLTGLRQGDLLRLKMSDIKDDGIHVRPHKTQTTTGKKIIYEWSEELRKSVDLAKQVRPVDVSPFLFCNKYGQCYANDESGRSEGWATLWQKFMKRVMSETKIKDRFTEHDLRAKVASDADNLEHARTLLAHADSKVTQRVYRRKAEKVKPLR